MSVRSRVEARLLADPRRDLDLGAVDALVRSEAPLLADDEARALSAEVFAAVTGLGPLAALLDDEWVTDVLVNGDGRVWVERGGVLTATGIVVDEREVLRLVERVVSPLGLRADRSSPIVDARLPDGSRLSAVLRPLGVDGPCVAIRRFATRPVSLEAFAAPEVVSFLARAVRSRATIVVSGGTGAGKTTLLGALAVHIGDGERVVTIEDAAELRLPKPHVVRLEGRPANGEGAGAVTIRDLVRAALRLRPDRVIVGEVRGGEALDLLQALNTGHEGSLTTVHANTAAGALRRLETLALFAATTVPLDAVRDQLAAAVDIVVHLARRGQHRSIAEVVEVDAASLPGRALATRRLADGERVVAAARRRWAEVRP